MIKQTIKAAMVDAVIRWIMLFILGEGVALGGVWLINTVAGISIAYVLPAVIMGVLMLLMLVRTLYSAYIAAKSWDKMKDVFSDIMKNMK